MIRNVESYNISQINKDVKKICKQCDDVYLGKGNSKYCSSSCSHMNSYEARMFDPAFRLNKLMAMAKNRSLSKDLPYNLDLEYLRCLWEESEGSCILTGIPFELDRPIKGKVHPYAPSLDRIVPAVGYVKGNVRIICYQMNIALSEFGLEQFENLVQNYISFR